jgi:hypothetical protein
MATKHLKVVSGFVVKVEYFEPDPTTRVQVKRRKEVSRVFHSRGAAETMLALLKKEDPERDYYIHEKTKRDDGGQIY